MRVVELKKRPKFNLLKQTDIQNMHYMQMPRWLFSDPRYADMSLEAKVTYTFLLNRFQLSRRKGWVNEEGEVFVIFPRLAMAQELRICEKRVTSAFRKLIDLNLIWERRCGQGEANQIYLAKIEPMPSECYECAPFNSPEYEDIGVKPSTAKALCGDFSTGMLPQQTLTSVVKHPWTLEGQPARSPRTAKSAVLQAQKRRFQNRQTHRSRTAESAVLKPQNWRFKKRRFGGPVRII